MFSQKCIDITYIHTQNGLKQCIPILSVVLYVQKIVYAIELIINIMCHIELCVELYVRVCFV